MTGSSTDCNFGRPLIDKAFCCTGNSPTEESPHSIVVEKIKANPHPKTIKTMAACLSRLPDQQENPSQAMIMTDISDPPDSRHRPDCPISPKPLQPAVTLAAEWHDLTSKRAKLCNVLNDARWPCTAAEVLRHSHIIYTIHLPPTDLA